MRRILAAAFLSVAAACAGAADWVPASPPGSVTEIALDASSPAGAAYAVTSAGIYRSDDVGRTWRLLPGSPNASAVVALAIDPGDPQRVVGVGCGARESTNGGESWLDASRGLPPSCTLSSLVPDPAVVARFLAGGGNGLFQAGFDSAGRVWSPVSDGLFSAVAGLTTQFSTDGSRLIWVAGPDGSTWANSAGTWFPKEPVPAPRRLSSCCFTLWAGTDHGGFRLDSNGWNPIDDPALTGFGVNDFAYAGDLVRGGLPYAATDRGIYRASPWGPFSSGIPDGMPARRVVADLSGRNVLALAGGVVYRYDYAVGRIRLVEPIDRISTYGTTLLHIAIDPPQPFPFDIIITSSDPSVIPNEHRSIWPLLRDDYSGFFPLAASVTPVTVTITTDPDVGTISISAPVLNPAPLLTFVSPDQAAAGSQGLVLRVTGGTGTYSSLSTVLWNGSPRPTRPVSVPCSLLCTEVLEADISAADLAVAGTATVRVSNPGPGGGTSPPLTFEVLTPRAATPCNACRRRPPRTYVPARG